MSTPNPETTYKVVIKTHRTITNRYMYEIYEETRPRPELIIQSIYHESFSGFESKEEALERAINWLDDNSTRT